ncbi:MAG: serine/threonine-protein kinase [Gemmatimonadaceae bacterium]
MIFDRELWHRTRTLFDDLIELDHNARRIRLEVIGAEDPALREAVERLLLVDVGSEAALSDYLFGSPRDTPPAVNGFPDPLRVVGQTVSHFRVVDYLAAGGMGVVYTAEDLQLGRTVALKFPLPYQRMEERVKERFINEARSAAALDHPNLCTVHEIGDSEHGVFLAMPLYPGETLKDRIAREGALPVADALDITMQITTGLASAHAAGIVHRDLKSANIMLLPGGGVKVLDFGLAKIRDIDLTRSNATLGTIGYAAPEQIRNGVVDARTDLWAIGVMLYEMLTGRLPFGGKHEISILHAILHDDAPPPSALNESVPSAFDDMIDALLQKNAGDRYPTAEALLSDAVALQLGAAPAHRAPFWKRTARRRRARKALLPVAALAAIGVIAGVSWTVYGRKATVASRAPTAEERIPVVRFVGNTAVIGSSAELLAAIIPANAGRRVRLRAGTYDLVQPLTVPDGMTLEGEGVMRFDPDGHPTGFSDGSRTTLRMTAAVGGDILTLGHGVTLRNVEIVDLAGRSGNVVAVGSRRPGDRVSAAIIESMIVNPNPLTIGAGGALGRGLLITTRNLNMGADPPPDEGAAVTVRVLRSVIRSPVGGGGFFAYNFSANSRISLEITRSVVGGSNEANGGVSRPDAVHDSEVHITSQGNVYRNEWENQCVSALMGWNLIGGSGAPIPLAVRETARNRLRLRSVDDRIEGFTTGVFATGSRRFFAAPLNAAPSGNHIDLRLFGTRISTPSCASLRRSENTTGIPAARLVSARDIQLIGAWVQNETLAAGDGNTVRAELRNVTGSGARSNKYDHVAASSGPLPARLQGTGNRLEIVGNPQTFGQTNRRIHPAPAAEFFIQQR